MASVYKQICQLYISSLMRLARLIFIWANIFNKYANDQ